MNKTQLIIKRGHCCEVCKNTIWNGKPILLEIHHIKPPSEKEDDLQLLCPNCHSQTPNWKNRHKKQITDNEFIEKSKNTKNIRQLLIALGLPPMGDYYNMVKETLSRLNIPKPCKKMFNRIKRKCKHCNKITLSPNVFCSIKCSNSYNGKHRNKKTKIIWPVQQDVNNMVKKFGFCETARKLGVSDNAVRKFLKKHI